MSKAMMTESFPKLMIDTKLQTQESQRSPNKIKTKKCTPGIIIFKLEKNKIKDEKNIVNEAGEEEPQLYRIKDENEIRFIFRNYANRKRVCEINVERNINQEVCVEQFYL